MRWLAIFGNLHRRRGLPLAIAIGLLVILNYADIFRDLIHDWYTDRDSSQGLVLAPLAIYIAFARWKSPDPAKNTHHGWGLLLLAASCAMLLAGRFGADFFFMRLSFVCTLASLILLFGGLPILRRMSLSLLLLIGAIPAPAVVYAGLSNYLRLLSSSWATLLAQLCGISIFREGNIIHLANLSFGVADSCSGMQSLSALLFASLVLGYIYLRTFTARCLLLAIAIPIAIAVNIVRITGTAALADFRDKLAVGFYHAFTGWFVFLIGFAALYVVSRCLRAAEPKALQISSQ